MNLRRSCTRGRVLVAAVLGLLIMVLQAALLPGLNFSAMPHAATSSDGTGAAVFTEFGRTLVLRRIGAGPTEGTTRFPYWSRINAGSAVIIDEAVGVPFRFVSGSVLAAAPSWKTAGAVGVGEELAISVSGAQTSYTYRNREAPARLFPYRPVPIGFALTLAFWSGLSFVAILLLGGAKRRAGTPGP